jgi:polyhydroxybutyrate depolymerase
MRTLAAVLLALAAACSNPTDRPVDRPLEFGGARPVTLQVPDDFDDARTYPLLVILHGYSANAFVQQGYLKLNDVASTHEMLVLAPEGTVDSMGKQFWNADPTCCDLDGSGVDDVAYLGGLIDAVRAAWPVDAAQVAVIGHSNGAFMAYRMACERADVVTEIAGLAGHASTVPCDPVRPVAVLHIHGTADDTVPYETGTFMGFTSPGAVDSVAQWATHDGCTGALAAGAPPKDLEQRLDGAETTVGVTAGCPAGAAAELWTIEGGGHLPVLTATFPTELLAWLDAHRR